MRSGTAQAVRIAVFFSNGQWALIRNGELAWTRPEFLAGIVSAVWGELPEQEALAHELEVEGHQDVLAAYIHRVNRHVRDLQRLPEWLRSLPSRMAANFVGKPHQATLDDMQHDTFGFHKLVVVATDGGRLAALDAGSGGSIKWSVDLRQFAPDASFTRPVLKAHRGYVEVRDESLRTPLYVNTATAGLIPAADVHPEPSITSDGQTLVTYELVDGQLKGYLGTTADAVWSFVPPTGERILGVTERPLHDPVASIGKVLADRRVLYKHLNPNLVLVTAIGAPSTASLYLLDGASGHVLYATSHPDVDISRPIAATMSENWFTYSFTLDAWAAPASRGAQLVVSELFESPVADDRGPLGAAVNASLVQPARSSHGDAGAPHVVSHAFHVGDEIAHLAATQTRQGITTRSVLAVLRGQGALVALPRLLLDARRPVGRDASAAEAAAEGLVRYAPVVPLDPAAHLNHARELVGVAAVLTAPALVESTCLVFAFGLDVFGTRVAPSSAFDVLGKGFGKTQVVGTAVGLLVAAGATSALVSRVFWSFAGSCPGSLTRRVQVRRKQINSLWQVG